MEQYIGTKLIKAKPMNRQEYNNFRGWDLPEDEDGTDEGFLVEYVDGGKANTEQYDGYVSWSPKEVFEKAYKASGNMSFGDAIVMLKAGYSVTRSGWNGKNMFVYLMQGSNDIAFLAKYGFGEYEGEPVFRDSMIMKTVDNQLVPWTVTQTDALAEDWCIAQ